VKVAIERHLVGAGRLRDRVHADGMDASAIEQLARSGQDALARGQTDAPPFLARHCG
jgi:hypothetical protein